MSICSNITPGEYLPAVSEAFAVENKDFRGAKMCHGLTNNWETA